MKRFLLICLTMASLHGVDFQLKNNSHERIWTRITDGAKVVENGDFDYFSADPGVGVTAHLLRELPTKVEIWKGSLPIEIRSYEKGVQKIGNVAKRASDLMETFPAKKGSLLVSFDGTGLYQVLSFGPNFELYNKSDKTILFRLKPEGAEFKLHPGDKKQLSLKDLSKAHGLDMWPEAARSASAVSYNLVPGRTLYLSWAGKKPKKGLYPQTGPLGGFLGTTESGLSIKNNIKGSEIQLVS